MTNQEDSGGDGTAVGRPAVGRPAVVPGQLPPPPPAPGPPAFPVGGSVWAATDPHSTWEPRPTHRGASGWVAT